jgi:release factor glutamine methyltransferase
LESELLLSHTLKLDRVGLYLNYDLTLSADELACFKEVLQRRTHGEPLPYITGYQEFWSIRFKVGPGVLIPRPESEILVEAALRLIDREGWSEPRMIDVGTGCGAIAISLAKSLPFGKVVATDISPEAIALAEENAALQSVSSQVSFVQGDLLSFLKGGGGPGFDLVISNPPYIKQMDIDNLQPEIRIYEPRKAINGGPEGIDFYRRLVAEAPSCLRHGGWLILEIGADQGAKVLDLIGQTGQFDRLEIIPDYSGKSRAAIAHKSCG